MATQTKKLLSSISTSEPMKFGQCLGLAGSLDLKLVNINFIESTVCKFGVDIFTL